MGEEELLSVEKSSQGQTGVGEVGGAPAAGGRVLVVRDDRLRERVAAAVSSDAVAMQIDVVPSFLAVLGELAGGSAAAVIGPVTAITGMPEATAAALRELAPGARLVVTAGADDREAAHGAVRAGFDAALIEPFDAFELARALHLPPVDDGGGRAVAGGSGVRAGARKVPPTTSEQPLGDTDLIDLLMADQGPIEPDLAAMIAQQSGLVGVAVLAAGQAPPDGQPAANIVYRGRRLGVLSVADAVEQATLEAWAAWAARWLAIGRRLKELNDLAMRDELTGAWNRRYFNRFLGRITQWAREQRQQVTLLVFDIDDFKSYNDRYGHAAGDEILRETARLMQAVVRDHDVVARIGGDEFAVIFWDAEQDAEGPRRRGSKHPQDVMRCAGRFQQAICEHRFPALLDEAPGTLTISGGLASFPWDGTEPEQLLDKADRMAMQSKQQGKNAITFGPGASAQCETDGAGGPGPG